MIKDERDDTIVELQAQLRAARAVSDQLSRKRDQLSAECTARLDTIVRNVHLTEHYKRAVERIAASKAGTFRGIASAALAEAPRLELHPRDADAAKMLDVVVAARALVTQPMLVKGDSATWGDVAESHIHGGKLLAALMRAVSALDGVATSQKENS